MVQGQNKANLAELSIKHLKIRLYMAIRHQLTRNWPSALQDVVTSLNNDFQKSLGGYTANQVVKAGPAGDDMVKTRLASLGKKQPFTNSPEQKQALQEAFSTDVKNKSYMPDSYVYINLKPSAFSKESDLQVSYFKITASL